MSLYSADSNVKLRTGSPKTARNIYTLRASLCAVIQEVKFLKIY